MEQRAKNSLAVATAGVVSSMSFFDAFIHKFPKHRFTLGNIIGDHIGNTLYTAAPIIGATFIGEVISQEGIRKNNKALEICGKMLPIIAIATMAVINLMVESFPGNFQFTGDVIDGLLTIPLAFVATKMAVDRFRSASISQIPSDVS